MAIVHPRYVRWVPRGGRGRRRNRTGVNANAAVDLAPPRVETVVNPGISEPWASPTASWSDDNGPHTLGFAFWSVTGNRLRGAFVQTEGALHLDVGDAAVIATAWYLPTGGGHGEPGGQAGYFIDAFDVPLGGFVDDDFVDVTTHPNLTAAANEDGFVPTNSREDIRAYETVEALPFLDWTVVTANQTLNDRVLTGAAGASAVAFAFYMQPVIAPWGKWVQETTAGGMVFTPGVLVDGGGWGFPIGGGRPVPIGPWGPMLTDLLTGLHLADLARTVSPALRATLLDVAVNQVAASAQSLVKQMQVKELAKTSAKAKK